MKTVNDLLPGEWGSVIEIGAEVSIRQRLMDLGIIEGVRIDMVGSAPLNDPVQIKVRGTLLALRRNEARMLIIESDGTEHHDRRQHRHRFGRKSKLR